MCTLSFQPLASGFALAMNRDEQRTRATASPPALFPTRSGQALYPYEPNGGTWIGLNSNGLIFALLNWYERTIKDANHERSRGSLIPACLQFSAMPLVEESMDALVLPGLAPLRLFGLDLAQKQLLGWSWDGRHLERMNYSWQAQHWFSSGYDEPEATRVRAETAASARQQDDAGTLEWLRRLHRSHAPHPGPNAICMHRQDAVTVSYTEIVVRSTGAEMIYRPGAPCQQNREYLRHLTLLP